MKTVRMKYAISGGRADGTEWPPAGGELTCEDAEAAELVGAQIAEYASGAGESAPPAPEPEKKPRAAAKK